MAHRHPKAELREAPGWAGSCTWRCPSAQGKQEADTEARADCEVVGKRYLINTGIMRKAPEGADGLAPGTDK